MEKTLNDRIYFQDLCTKIYFLCTKNSLLKIKKKGSLELKLRKKSRVVGEKCTSSV